MVEIEDQVNTWKSRIRPGLKAQRGAAPPDDSRTRAPTLRAGSQPFRKRARLARIGSKAALRPQPRLGGAALRKRKGQYASKERDVDPVRISSEINCAVSGASRIPLRKWPVAKTRFSMAA